METGGISVTGSRLTAALPYRHVYLPVDITDAERYVGVLKHTSGKPQSGVLLVLSAQLVESHYCDFSVFYRYRIHIFQFS